MEADRIDSLAKDAIPDKHKVDPLSGQTIAPKTKEERLMVLRLDLLLLVYCCVAQIVKGLDQQNVAAAYVSGMKEDLKIKSNEYNLFTTFFNVGYAIFVIPSQILMTRLRPSRYLPFLELSWGLLTLGLYRVTATWQIYVLRVFIGAFEASGYGGAVVLLMSWYTPRELGFRIAFYHASQWSWVAWLVLAGGLQAAIYRSLDGTNGLEGWRWMFIIDAVITVFVAVSGLFLLPDYPSRPNPMARWWLKDRHIELSIDRNLQYRRADTKRFTLYMFPVLYISCQLAQQGYLYFNLWLKSLKDANGHPTWSVEDVNALPIGGYAISIVCVWLWGLASDWLQTRWVVIVAQACLGLIPGIIMSVWNVPLGAKYFAYFLCFTFIATTPSLFAWLSDMTPHDAEQRAFIVGCSIAGWYGFNSWANLLIWPAKTAPHYHYAWQVTIALWIFVICWVAFLRFVDHRYIRPYNRRMGEDLYQAPQELEVTDVENEDKHPKDEFTAIVSPVRAV